MKIALIIIGILVAAVVIIIVIVSQLPEKHVATRSIHLKRSPAEVYAVLRDFESYAKWRDDVNHVEILGASQFREHGSHDKITYEVVEEVPNQLLVTRIVDKDLGYSGSWLYALTSDNHGGTTLRITEDGAVSNPLFRFLSRYVLGHTATMDRYLAALAKHLGEGA